MNNQTLTNNSNIEMNRYFEFKAKIQKIKEKKQKLQNDVGMDSVEYVVDTDTESHTVSDTRIRSEFSKKEGFLFSSIVQGVRENLRIPEYVGDIPKEASKPSMVIPFLPGDRVIKRLKEIYDDYTIVFRNWGTSSNEMVDALKMATLMHAREIVGVKWRSSVELGGEIDVMYMRARGPLKESVHVCVDETNIQHILNRAAVDDRLNRRFAAEGYKGVHSREALQLKELVHNGMCKEPNACQYECETLVIDHLTNDLGVDDVTHLMRNHKARSVVGVILFTPEMLRKSHGIIPLVNATYDIDIEKDELYIRFVGDRERSRVFTLSKYMSWIERTVSSDGTSTVYIERVESGRGPFYVYKGSMIDDRSLLTNAVPRHRIWFETSEKYYVIRMMKPKHFMMDVKNINNFQWVEHVIPKHFYDQVYSYALRLSVRDFKLNSIREHIIGKSARVIVNIKDVSVAYDLSIQTQEDLSVFIFMQAYIDRYNMSVTLKEMLRRLNFQRQLGATDLTTLCMFFFWSHLKKAFDDWNFEEKADDRSKKSFLMDYDCKVTSDFLPETASKILESMGDGAISLLNNLYKCFDVGRATCYMGIRGVRDARMKYLKDQSIQMEVSSPQLCVEYSQVLVIPASSHVSENRTGEIVEGYHRSFRARFCDDDSKYCSFGGKGTKALEMVSNLLKRIHDKDTKDSLCTSCRAVMDGDAFECLDIECGCICGLNGHMIEGNAPMYESEPLPCYQNVDSGLLSTLLTEDEESSVTTDMPRDTSDESIIAGNESDSSSSSSHSSFNDFKPIGTNLFKNSGDEVKSVGIYWPFNRRDYNAKYFEKVCSEALHLVPLFGMDVTSKKKKNADAQRFDIMIVPVDKGVKYTPEEIVYFSGPRDIQFVTMSLGGEFLSEEAKVLKDKISRHKFVVDSKEVQVGLSRADYASYNEIPASTPLTPAAAPLAVLQDEYDRAFPGISTISYKDDHYKANQGDINIDITVPKLTLDMTKWYIPKVMGCESILRTAQGGLNPQTPVALLGSILKRNLDVEYQSAPQNVGDSITTIVKRAASLICIPDYMQKFKEFNEDSEIEVVSESAIDTYLSKQTPDVIRELAETDLRDNFIEFHMHALMNKDTTKPKLDGSIVDSTPVVQTIVYNDKKVNTVLSPLAETLTIRLLTILRPEVAIYMKKNIPELEKFISENVLHGADTCTWLDCDGTKFDKSQQETALLVEMYWYKLLGAKGFDFDKWFGSIDSKSMLSYRAKMKLQLAFQRSSGNRNTAMGNSLVMLSAVFGALKLEYNNLLCAVNLGDDIVIAINKPIDTLGFDDAVGGVMNISVKMTASKQGYILGHYILQRGDRLKLVYDIHRKLESLGRMDKMREEKLKEVFISFSDNVKTLDDVTWIPLLQRAVQIRMPALGVIDVWRMASAMKALAVDLESFKQLFLEYREH